MRLRSFGYILPVVSEFSLGLNSHVYAFVALAVVKAIEYMILFPYLCLPIQD